MSRPTVDALNSDEMSWTYSAMWRGRIAESGIRPKCSISRALRPRYCADVLAFQPRRVWPSANQLSAYSPNVSGFGRR